MKSLFATCSVVAAIVASGCACGPAGGGEAARLEGVTWRLMEAGGAVAQPVAGGVRTAFFRLSAADHRVTGHTGVNQFGGPYELSGSRLSFGDLVMTEMAGAPELRRQEAAFTAALANTASWRPAGEDRIELLDAAGERVASFAGPSSQ